MRNIQAIYEKWLNSNKVSKNDKDILKNMSSSQIEDAFFKDIEFGTAGMRGVLGPGTNRLNEFSVTKACVAFAKYVLAKYENAKTMGIVISHDNRHYSREFTLLSAKIFNRYGIKAYIFDSLRPTPELSYAVRYTKACGGVMITASHNPKEYNGYKVYDEQGCQLVPEKIKPLLDILNTMPDEIDVEIDSTCPLAETIVLGKDVDDTYVELVENTCLNKDLDKKGFKIVYTPQHGTSYVNAMRIFKDLGYEVYPLLSQCDPDPDFKGTLSPNPEEKNAYIEPIKYAKEIGAQLICMTDPDGDRVGLAALDENGEYVLITGNQSAAMLIDYLFSIRKQRGTLSKNGVMYSTIVSSSLGRKIAESYGVKVEEFLTGFKYIGERIHYYEVNGGPTFEFGYEESYGCLIKPFVRDKDGLQAILLYCEMALYYSKQNKNLLQVYDELQQKYGYHHDVTYSKTFLGATGQKEMNDIMGNLHKQYPNKIGEYEIVKVEDYLTSKSYDFINNTIKDITLDKSDVVKMFLNDGSTLTVRPSGTEPKCKFYVGAIGVNEKDSLNKAQGIYESLMKYLNI